jgi:hypothetical protein
MEGFEKKKKYLKTCLIFIVAVFVLTLNIVDDFNYTFDMKFEGVPETANQQLAWLYFQVVAGSYLMNRAI